MSSSSLSTGLPGLDKILRGILPGDNIVWQFDAVEDYRAFVTPFCEHARKSGRTFIYFRFADHPPLLTDEAGVDTRTFDPQDGFETFTSRVHRVIRDAGRGAHYLFDCLSGLATCWYSDQMLANFFQLTCPYLFDLETLAYFGIFRNQHSSQATGPILATTQLFLELYRHKDMHYVRPVKVQHRYSAAMNTFYRRAGESFTPVDESCVIAEIMTSAKWSGLRSDRLPGFWDRAFIEAQALLNDIHAGRRPAEDARDQMERLLPMIITRDDRILALARKYLTLEDILDVRRRMIGTGLIGGKAVGMLLGRAIIKKNSPRCMQLLEEHDSFFIGTDVFYTYVVRNGVWWVRQQQRETEDFYENATRGRRLIIAGSFPEDTLGQFQEMLDYFGQAPFIVRSSSLLEDSFDNAFAGKYESVFCANQGPRAQRLEDFLAAVKTIYASSMSERALRYRAQRDMLDKDEQMALLVMRVSGRRYGRKFFPPVAGVGFSFNPYVWHKDINPQTGVLRLVFGLGTRAVNQSDDDYTRLVALNAPDLRPEQNVDEVRQYAQRYVDYIDLDANHLTSGHFLDLVEECTNLQLNLVSSLIAKDSHRQNRPQSGRYPERHEVRILTFNKLLKETSFVDDMREILLTLQAAYEHPVDIEFTANFTDDGAHKINLLQCRPLQVRGWGSIRLPPTNVPEEHRIIAARGAVIGQSRVMNVDRFIYVVPSSYSELNIRERHEVAQVLSRVNNFLPRPERETTVLLGPGRWCTTIPSLGIPTTFADINRAAVICEIVTMRENLIPDVSLGTHFLNELVEMDVLYLAIFPQHSGNILNEHLLLSAPSELAALLPQDSRWDPIVRVIPAASLAPPGMCVRLVADATNQKVECFCIRNVMPEARNA